MSGTRLWFGSLTLLLVLLLLTGCSQQPTPTPTPAATPIPPIPLEEGGGVVKASGNVVPALKADLGFAIAGRLKAVAVDVGDQVEAGELLAALDSAAAEAAVAQAQAALQAAQARLKELQAGPRSQEIEAARARLETAKAQLAQAEAASRVEEVAAEAGLAAAEAGLKQAQANLAIAQASLNKLLSSPTPIELELARQEVDWARDQLWATQAQRDGVKGSKATPSYVVDAAEAAVLQAEVAVRMAELKYEQVKAGAREEDIAAARALVDQARGGVEAARAQVTTARAELEWVKAGPRSEAVAEAQVRSAQAELDLLTAGARPEKIAAAEADVAQAQAALQRAQADLASIELRAPFAGTITARQVNPGQTVQPGQSILTLADLGSLRVETTDLSERDVRRVAVGQPATVFVEALGTEIPGRVTRIAPQANVVAGDVVYTVVIELDEQPAGLRWGMSVEVEIEVKM